MAEKSRIGILSGTVALSCSLALVAGCSAPAAHEQEPPLTVEVAVMAPAGSAAGPIESFPFTLRRDRESRLAFRTGGVVSSVAVRPGERLGQGALVAAVDATAQAAAVRRAEAEVARLERAAGRYDRLAEAGAVGSAQALDSASALAQARAALAAARHDLADTRIRMPFAGIVLQRHVEVGEVAGPGAPVATVVDDRAPLLAVADVPAEAVAGLRAGVSASLRLPGLPGPLPATLLRSPAAADPASGTVRIELRLANPAGLISGQSGSLSFDRTSPGGSAPPPVPGAGVIPAEALLWVKDGRAGVYVIDGQSRARGRVVRFLGMSGDSVRIAGLAPGVRVITTGAGFAREGQAVAAVGGERGQ